MQKRIIAIVAVLFSSILIGTFLYDHYLLKPEFNIFGIESLTKFDIQNIGKADAHNVKIKVNGTWIPTFKMNVTKVEHGYSVSPEQIATVFYGIICGYNEHSGEWFELTKRVVPYITGGETNGTTFVKLMVIENGTFRYLTDDEVTSLIDAFETPRAYYAFGETAIDVLRVGEVKTSQVTLEGRADSCEVSISCDEGITSHFFLP
jgi:hypothetical protein